MAGERPYVDDILAAVREGRIGAATAAEWLELRAAEHARQAREVRAHADQGMRDRVHNAVDSALSGDAQDEYSRLFPPSKPLGPPQSAEEHYPGPVIYRGQDQGQRTRRPGASWDGYVTGAVPVDDLPGADDYVRLFPAWYRRRCPGGGDAG